MNEYTYESISTEDEASFCAAISEQMMTGFRESSGDINPLHCDEDFAKQNGYPGRVVYGMLTSSLYSTLAGVYLPGKYCLLQGVDARFHKPVFVGDRLTVSGKVAQKHDSVRMIVIKAEIKNQRGETVSSAIIKAGFLPQQ